MTAIEDEFFQGWGWGGSAERRPLPIYEKDFAWYQAHALSGVMLCKSNVSSPVIIEI